MASPDDAEVRLGEFGVANEANRQAFHALGGLAIIAGVLLTSRSTALIVLGVITVSLLTAELLRRSTPSVNRWFTSTFAPVMRREEKKTHLTGSSYFLVAAVVLILVFPREIALPSLAFLALGDTAAAVVGRRFGGGKPGGKTVAGSLACLASCVLAGFVLSAVVPVTLVQILAGAAGATLAEAFPLPVNDNLTIPLLSAAVMALVGFLL